MDVLRNIFVWEVTNTNFKGLIHLHFNSSKWLFVRTRPVTVYIPCIYLIKYIWPYSQIQCRLLAIFALTTPLVWDLPIMYACGMYIYLCSRIPCQCRSFELQSPWPRSQYQHYLGFNKMLTPYSAPLKLTGKRKYVVKPSSQGPCPQPGLNGVPNRFKTTGKARSWAQPKPRWKSSEHVFANLLRYTLQF